MKFWYMFFLEHSLNNIFIQSVLAATLKNFLILASCGLCSFIANKIVDSVISYLHKLQI